MQDGACTGIPVGVVPYQGKTANAVEVEVAETELTGFLVLLALHICHRLVVGQSHGKGSIEEKVLGEDPVVCIATTARYVGILHRTKTQFVVDVATELFTHLVDYHIFQFLPVHLQRMAGVTYACQPATGASALNSTLRISCWIREFSVVKYVVKIKSFYTRFHAVEVYSFDGRCVYPVA